MVSTRSALLAFCFVLNLLCTSALADTTCKKILERKEWRALLDVEKKSYLDAVKCLQSLPAHDASRPASWTRYDEFHKTHIDMALRVHFLGQFLPWHRLFLKSYENALRNECGYSGAQPYWDWSIDSDPPNLISKSPIWDPIIGFGGNGVSGTYVVPVDPDPNSSSKIFKEFYGGCIKDGPFASYTLKSGPGLLVTEHCITRRIDDSVSIWLNSSAIAHVLSLPSFETFRYELEGDPPSKLGPHGGGHGAVGAEMTNLFSSLGDPLFYLHHTALDRLWWRWQEACPDRLYEISGPKSKKCPGDVTLDYQLKMGNVGPTLPIRAVMDIRKEPSCYIYV